MMEKLDAGIWTQAGGKVNGQQDNWVHYEPEGWVESRNLFQNNSFFKTALPRKSRS